MNKSLRTASVEETMVLASQFGRTLRRGDVVAFYGDLGSGKTQFVKGIGRAFQINSNVTSPSFVILNRYEGKDDHQQELIVYHFDLYRIKTISEIYDLGYEEFLKGNGICLIEWAELLGSLLPKERYDIHMSLGETENERQIEIRKMGDA